MNTLKKRIISKVFRARFLKRLFQFLMLSILAPLHSIQAEVDCSATPTPKECLVNPVGSNTQQIGEIVLKVITWILGIAGTAAVLMIIVGGFQYITSAGSKEKIETAKTYLTYAIIGAVVILVAYVVVQTVNKLITGQPYTPAP